MDGKKITEMIALADIHEIDSIFEAALNRKRELYPEWELLYCAMPKSELKRLEEKKTADRGNDKTDGVKQATSTRILHPGAKLFAFLAILSAFRNICNIAEKHPNDL